MDVVDVVGDDGDDEDGEGEEREGLHGDGERKGIEGEKIDEEWIHALTKPC